MKDYEDNTDDEVMREHEEEFAMRLRRAAPYEQPKPQPVYIVGRWKVLLIGLVLLALAFVLPILLS